MEYKNFYNGIPLIESDVLVLKTDTPKRKAKTKRIQKKWIKRYGYKYIPDPKIFYVDDKIIAHPTIIKKILKAIAEVQHANS